MNSDGVLIAFTKGAFLSVSHSSGAYHGFDALLDEPILLRKGGMYHLVARIFGEHSSGTVSKDTTLSDAVI